jgi:hypothetical protein
MTFHRRVAALAAALFVLVPARSWCQEAVTTVEVTVPSPEAEVGQEIQFTAAGKDADGRVVSRDVAAWFTLPFDIAAAEEDGTVIVYGPGVIQVGAVVGGKVGYTSITVRPARVARIEIAPPSGPFVVGGSLLLSATPLTEEGVPRTDAEVAWSSSDPAVLAVDDAGLATGVAPGRALVRATSEGATAEVAIEVIANPVRRLSIEPRTSEARTGDVVRLTARAADEQGAAVADPFLQWSVNGDGVAIDPDGGFVALQAGTFMITATSGRVVATASVVVTPRNVARAIEVVGRMPARTVQAAEQWIIGDHAYVSTIADRVWVFDISDPAKPVQTDSIVVDARTVNDVSTTADGKIGMLTREGAASRRNGIVFFDASDPAHAKVVSEYTETVTGGVHSAFIDGHYVYLTDDATGSMRVIDFADVESPREVARWQVERPTARTIGAFTAGRYLHDVQVVDGLAYLAYWKDGLIILDVGAGIRGGSPENPQFVSRLPFNHHELYGPGWISGTHAVFRYEDYVFVGDEVFPPIFDIQGKGRIPTRGMVHVVNVSDIEHPRRVAWYEVPEGGSHNMWVENDILMMGDYQGGARVVDVSGELRGDLYRQGRDIAALWTGDPEGYRPNMPLTWGAQPHEGLIYFNDINSGIWITRLGDPRELGSATAPPW